MIEILGYNGQKVLVHEFTTVDEAKKFIDKIKKKSGVIWIRVITPNDEEIAALYGITSIPVEELQQTREEEDERAKVRSDKYLEVVYASPERENGEIVTTPIYFYLQSIYLLSIEKERNNPIDGLVIAMRTNKKKFMFKKPSGYLLGHLMDRINDDFLRYIDRAAAKVDLFRKQETLSKETIQAVYNSSVTLSNFNQALLANAEVLNVLRKSYYKIFTKEDREAYFELYSDVLRILDTEKIEREVMSNLFNLQAIVSNNRVNNFIKTFTFLVIIITVPSLISSIYGMNIELPLGHNPNAFYIITGLMAITSLILIYFFRKL